MLPNVLLAGLSIFLCADKEMSSLHSIECPHAGVGEVRVRESGTRAHRLNPPELRIAMDMWGRVEKDYFHFAEPYRNVAKICLDAEYLRANLDEDSLDEFAVKYNWWREADPESGRRKNMATGAKGDGRFFLYDDEQHAVQYLGAIEGKFVYISPSSKNGWHDVFTEGWWGTKEVCVSHYTMAEEHYGLVSTALWQIGENGARTLGKVLHGLGQEPRRGKLIGGLTTTTTFALPDAG